MRRLSLLLLHAICVLPLLGQRRFLALNSQKPMKLQQRVIASSHLVNLLLCIYGDTFLKVLHIPRSPARSWPKVGRHH